MTSSQSTERSEVTNTLSSGVTTWLTELASLSTVNEYDYYFDLGSYSEPIWYQCVMALTMFLILVASFLNIMTIVAIVR